MQAPIRILGVDPGLRATGWGVVSILGNALTFIASGTVKAPLDGELARRLVAIHDGLTAVIGAWQPSYGSLRRSCR